MPKKKSEAFEKQNLFILILLIVFFILTISLYFVFNITSLDYSKSENKVSENSSIIVTRVIDGDTFELSSGEIVRLICVDAPEHPKNLSENFGAQKTESFPGNKKGYEEAKQFLSDLILNKSVRLEKDVSDKDSYGRLLRYAYINVISDSCLIQDTNPNELSDQTCIGSNQQTKEVFVNKEIVKNGHGTLFPYGNDTKRCNEIAS